MKTLVILPRYAGFFSLVFQVLGSVYLAQKKGIKCVVYFNKHCPYWSQNGYNDSRNVWEYYFEPLSDISINDLFSQDSSILEEYSLNDFLNIPSSDVIVSNEYPPVVEWFSPLKIEAQRPFVHSLFEKYVRPKSHIINKVNDFFDKNFKGKMLLGIHYRGKEKINGHGSHPDYVIPDRAHDLSESYLNEISLFKKRYPDSRIFVATDSASFLKSVCELYGDDVVYQDAFRLSESEECIGIHHSSHVKTEGAKFGEEVLMDALLLSKSNFFIHGISNVSSAVLHMNPTLMHTDVEYLYGPTEVYNNRI